MVAHSYSPSRPLKFLEYYTWLRLKTLRYLYGTFAFVLMICRPATYSPKTTTTRLGVEACLFDRENLDLPFSSQKKIVALLGGK